MKHHRFHQAVWSFLRVVLGPYIRRRFGYTYETCSLEGPVLVMGNHDSNWDPLFLGLAFPKQMYFVASEHIFRWGIVTWILKVLLAPISRMKGTTAGDTAMTIIRRLKKGYNVGMFANGSRSFNGISEDILPSTGKLARVSGATLVTYRLDGGYFTEPRWNFSGIRRGKIRGKIMNIYTPDVLKKMSVDEINEAINRDLYVDAYAVQREAMVPFKGSRPAESLESVLFVCPKCGALGHMHSKIDRFWCDSCGYEVRYNDYGFFEGSDVIFDSVTDWDKFQSEELKKLCDSAEEGKLFFTDDGFELCSVSVDHSATKVGTGSIALYPDRFECCGKIFPISELGGFALHGPVSVNFSHEGISYEVKTKNIVCTRKYQTIIHHILNRGALLQS